MSSTKRILDARSGRLLEVSTSKPAPVMTAPRPQVQRQPVRQTPVMAAPQVQRQPIKAPPQETEEEESESEEEELPPPPPGQFKSVRDAYSEEGMQKYGLTTKIIIE